MAGFDANHWTARLGGADCALCPLLELAPSRPAPADAVHLADLVSGPLFLRGDGAFRGWCMLVFKRHIVELPDLTEPERREWIEDVARVAAAVREVCRPAKLNYAMLGNEQPHLHAHVIPRYPQDGRWGRSPWEQAAQPVAAPLDAAALRELADALRLALLTR